MFYLKEFFKLLRDNIILSLVFVISLTSFISLSHNKMIVDKEVSLNQKMKLNPYFNALISNNTNLNSVIRKMKNLPGVSDVQVTQSNQLKSEVNQLKERFGEGIVSSLSTLNYRKIKIELDKGIHAKNQSLIKEYLGKLVGKSSLTVGMVKTPKQIKLDREASAFKVLDWGSSYLISLSGLMFFISTFLLARQASDISFLIERFQRKTMVKEKILISGLSVITVVLLASNIYFNANVEMISILAVIAVFVGTYTISILTKKNLKA